MTRRKLPFGSARALKFQEIRPFPNLGTSHEQLRNTASLSVRLSTTRRVERLIDALRLSRASGIPMENLVEHHVEKLAAPFHQRACSAGRGRTSPDARGR